MNTTRQDKSLTNLVRAEIADYMRRKEVLEKGDPIRRVRMEMVYLNSRILESVGEIAGARFAESFIKDFSAAKGYAKSDLASIMSESTYKRYKGDILTLTAKRLYLI